VCLGQDDGREVRELELQLLLLRHEVDGVRAEDEI
jgi:hypothetical protein